MPRILMEIDIVEAAVLRQAVRTAELTCDKVPLSTTIHEVAV